MLSFTQLEINYHLIAADIPHYNNVITKVRLRVSDSFAINPLRAHLEKLVVLGEIDDW